MERTNYPFGIVTDIYDGDEESLRDKVKKEYDLDNETTSRLEYGHLFRLSDNVQYRVFEADEVLLDDESESYFATGNVNIIDKVDTSEIVALVDDNAEMLLV